MALSSGTELAGEYRIERVLGAGGFGITYLATEIPLARDVTIKEYFPADFAARRSEANDAVPRSQDCAGDYQWGLDRFLDEAQTLARFDHRHIVRVYRYFRANNTGYMVLHFEQGQSFKSWLKTLGRAPRQNELDQIAAPLLDALQVVHAADVLHRDIAPDNIIIRPDGSPVLIDFGAARGDIARHSRTLSALVKPGYSPYEQYAEIGTQQGPWSDIYALGATLYHAVSGKRPPDAPSRIVKDELVSARDAALAAYRPGFLAAIDAALQLDMERRPQSVAIWRGQLLAPAAEPARRGVFQRAERAAAAEVAKPDARTLPLAPATPVPPPPDAPAAQGGLLDFIEGLQNKAQAAAADRGERNEAAPPAGGLRAALAAEFAAQPAAAAAAGRTTPVAGGAAGAAASPRPGAAQRMGADAAATPAVERKSLPLVVRKTPPRPRAVREGTRFNGWRPWMFKLLIGAGIAAAAVGLQDRFPSLAMLSSRPASEQSKESLLLRTLEAHSGGATHVAYGNDGRWIVSAGNDGTVKVWNAYWGTVVRTVPLPQPATALAVAGTFAATGHADGFVRLWDLDSGGQVQSFRRNEAAVWSLAFVGGVDRIVASSHDWSLALWNRSRPQTPQHVFEGHENSAQAVAASARQGLIASGSADRTVKLWDLTSFSLQRTYRGHRDFVSAVAFSPDGDQVAGGGLDGSVRIWQTGSSRQLRLLQGHSARVVGVAFAPAGDLLATASEDGTVKLWNTNRGGSLRTLGSAGTRLRGVTFSPDGRSIVTAAEDGVLRVWDATLSEQRASKRRKGDD